MAGQNQGGARLAERKPVQLFAATVLSLRLLTGEPAPKPEIMKKVPVLVEYQFKDQKSFEEKKKTDPKAAELENSAREKLGRYLTMLLEKYPQLAGKVRFYDPEIAVEAVSPERLAKLGGNRWTKTVGAEPGEGGRETYRINREGFTDFDLAMSMGIEVFFVAGGGLDFEQPPFNTDSYVGVESMARLFASTIQKPPSLEKADCDLGWASLFVSIMGEEAYKKAFMAGDSQGFAGKFDEVFGKGAFAKMCVLAIDKSYDEVYAELWKLIKASSDGERVIRQWQETGVRMGLLIEEPK